MDVIYFYGFSLLVSVWILFLGGDKKIENTVLGYFEFGQLGEKSPYIRLAAAVNLIYFGILIMLQLSQ